jgi:hypothetical protein
VDLDGPGVSEGFDLPGQLALMRDSGVAAIRTAFSWAEAEPVADVPTSFAATDRMVLAAARADIAVQPVVLFAPPWAAASEISPPDGAAYAAYLVALIGRYGPAGTLWAEHPEVRAQRIRAWEVWNEPDIRRFWSVHPGWAKPYVALLRTVYPAVKAADPGASVVAAGLPLASWKELAKLYAAGGGPWFDEANIHPFTRRPQDVLKIIRLTRKVMAEHGDARKSLRLTELTWASSAGHSTHNYGWETTEAGQAAIVRRFLPMLAAARARYRLSAFDWYTWASPPFGALNSFGYSGLLRVEDDGTFTEKPALAAWRETVAKLTR